MNRRRFLEMLTAGAFGALTLDVDKLLWVPGQKTIFIPPPCRNTVLTVDWIIEESLRVLKRDLQFAFQVHRNYDMYGVQ